MINAVLVFNNAGQPRLTKFYTQLVGIMIPARIVKANTNTGYKRSTETDLGNLFSSVTQGCRVLQLFAAAALTFLSIDAIAFVFYNSIK